MGSTLYGIDGKPLINGSNSQIQTAMNRQNLTKRTLNMILQEDIPDSPEETLIILARRIINLEVNLQETQRLLSQVAMIAVKVHQDANGDDSTKELFDELKIQYEVVVNNGSTEMAGEDQAAGQQEGRETMGEEGGRTDAT